MTTLASLLHPAYELCADGGATADGAQLVDGEWMNPLFGCDSLQFVVDNARALLNDTLAPRVAMPWPEPKAGAPSDPVQSVMDAAMGRDGEPIPRVAAAALRAAAAQIAAADPPPHVRGDTYWPWCNGRATAEEHLLAIATELEGVNG